MNLKKIDEEIIRELVEFADSDRLAEMKTDLNATNLVRLYLDIDHMLNRYGPRNPRKLLDSMARLADTGNE